MTITEFLLRPRGENNPKLWFQQRHSFTYAPPYIHIYNLYRGIVLNMKWYKNCGFLGFKYIFYIENLKLINYIYFMNVCIL